MLLSSLVAIVLSSAFTSVLAGDCTRTYTVQPNDICDGISNSQNVSTYQLAILNKAINKDCSNLTPGENLCLAKDGQDCQPVYTVQENNTCAGVASAYGIDLKQFYANNPQVDEVDCQNLYIGEVVCVAKSSVTYPHHSGTVPVMPSTALPANPTGSELPWCD